MKRKSLEFCRTMRAVLYCNCNCNCVCVRMCLARTFTEQNFINFRLFWLINNDKRSSIASNVHTHTNAHKHSHAHSAADFAERKKKGRKNNSNKNTKNFHNKCNRQSFFLFFFLLNVCSIFFLFRSFFFARARAHLWVCLNVSLSLFCTAFLPCLSFYFMNCFHSVLARH